MKITTPRTGRPLLLVLLALVVLLAGSADAGWFGKKQDNPDKMPSNHRFTRFPARSFLRGQLRLGNQGEWMLGKRQIKLAKDCLITGPGGDKAALADGQKVIVTGTVVGDVIMATGVRLLPPQWSVQPPLKTEGQKIPSKSNPSVGVIKDVPM